MAMFFVIFDPEAEAIGFYLTAHTVTMLIAFGTVAVLSTSGADAGGLEDYRGLFWQRPFLAGIFTASLLSLTGIPATMGFFGKFYILAAGAASSAWPIPSCCRDWLLCSCCLGSIPRRYST